MYKYSIGYSMWDESSSVQLLHEKKFTHEEITEMVAEAIAEIVEQTIGHELELYEYMFKIYNLWNDSGETVSVADHLIAEYGFVLDKIDVVWSIEGFKSVIKNADDSIVMKNIETYINTKNID